jgi:NAD(P)-dependent dehydrogenase (short-subunit alcohol dehydrogenase family)
MGGTVEALDEMHKVNVRAPYLLVQQSIPELEKSKGMTVLTMSLGPHQTK